jgi:hypothetical protein
VSIEGVVAKGGFWNIGPAAMLDPRHGLTELIWTGGAGGSNVHDPGFDVSLSGHILVIPQQRKADWVAKHNAPPRDNCLQVWTLDGALLNADAVGIAVWGHGVRMDRAGNLYIVAGGVLPPGQDKLYGITDIKAGYRVFGGHASLLKFRGLGNGKFALDEGQPIKVGKREMKALWAFGGVSNQSGGDCSCQHSRHDLDAWARSWIPARHLCSVLVLDSNGNRIARFGRYGNVDDADPVCGGIHLVNPRGVTVSDTGLYILDSDQNRLLKAALSYHAEETVPLAGGASSSTAVPTAAASGAAAQDAPAASPHAASARPEPTADEVCRGWLSLAMSYKRAGRKDKAREYLQKIVKEHPKSEYAARARRELAKL